MTDNEAFQLSDSESCVTDACPEAYCQCEHKIDHAKMASILGSSEVKCLTCNRPLNLNPTQSAEEMTEQDLRSLMLETGRHVLNTSRDKWVQKNCVVGDMSEGREKQMTDTSRPTIGMARRFRSAGLTCLMMKLRCVSEC